MALVKCSECGKEVSSQAAACIGCGHPLSNMADNTHSPKRKTSKLAWAVLVLLVLAGFWFTQSREFKESSLPILPLEVATRAAMMGSGEVLMLKNTSNSSLIALVTLKNPTTKEEKSFQVDIPAGEKSEIGHMEGWTVAAGDEITIFNESFQTWNGSAR